jgi:hypothetical protein
MMTATFTESATLFGDMNGPLAYWGPAEAPLAASATAPVQRVQAMATLLTPAEQAVLNRLSETLHGRTWAGTSALMSALFAAAAEPVAAR